MKKIDKKSAIESAIDLYEKGKGCWLYDYLMKGEISVGHKGNTPEYREKVDYSPDCCLRRCYNWDTVRCKYCKRNGRAKTQYMDYYLKVITPEDVKKMPPTGVLRFMPGQKNTGETPEEYLEKLQTQHLDNFPYEYSEQDEIDDA